MTYLVNAYNYTYRVSTTSVEEVRSLAIELSARFNGIVSYYEVRDDGVERLGTVHVSKSQEPVRPTLRLTGKQLTLF